MEIIELGDGLINYQAYLEKYFKTNVDVVFYNNLFNFLKL